MRRASLLLVVMLAAAVFAAPALAQDKWVRGPVTAMGADTLTVTMKGTATVFKVDHSTRLVAPGAGTAERQAEKAGKAGPKLSDFVKVGDSVEVHYKDAGGTNLATVVRPVASSEEAMSSEPSEHSGSSVQGTVVTVAADSIVVKVDGKDMSFAVTPKTRVTGPSGTGTKARELTKMGKPTPLTEFVKVSDRVMVYFTPGEATPTASAVRVVMRAFK